MEPWELAIRIVFLGLSIILMLVAWKAQRRSKVGRMTWVLVSFISFVIVSAAALLGGLYDEPEWTISNNLVLLLLLAMGANYLALVKG